jgi:hypothetical protein
VGSASVCEGVLNTGGLQINRCTSCHSACSVMLAHSGPFAACEENLLIPKAIDV